MDDQDRVFRALSDRNRRLLLDRLFKRDGQSIHELGSDLPMSRFGVAKHLRLLESAGLVSTRRVGRQRLHYLNPIPIQRIEQRWVSKYAKPWVGLMTALKKGLESAALKPAHIYHVFIRTTPERLWNALTDPVMTRRYFYGTSAASEWKPGAPYVYRDEQDHALIEGHVLEAEPPRRLVQSFRFAGRKDLPSRITWEIKHLGEACELTLTHEFEAEDDSYRSVDDPMGWPLILSGLKTFLETDRPLELAHE